MKLIKFGNSKLPKTTIIFNMSSSKDCPSRKLGLCKVASKCYARKPEIIYQNVLPYRERQEEYWDTTDIYQIMNDLDDAISRKRLKPTLFRFNESGDFHGRSCIERLSVIAKHLLKKWGIVTYGYTARKDLDFSRASFLVKGSGNDKGNHGKTVVIEAKQATPNGFVRCGGDCKICSICSSPTAHNIAFPKH